MVKILHKIVMSARSDGRHHLIVPVALVLVSLLQSGARGAPTSSPSGRQANNGNQPRPKLFGGIGNLFRRPTNPQPAATGTDGEKLQSQNMPKFVDSMPSAQTQNSRPSSFRKRVSDTFGLLREGVSNQFRSARENFSETVEELRDTWSSSSSASDARQN